MLVLDILLKCVEELDERSRPFDMRLIGVFEVFDDAVEVKLRTVLHLAHIGRRFRFLPGRKW